MKMRAVESPCAAKRTAWTLIGPDGKPYKSTVPGTLGGHRKGRLYGRMDCRAALTALERGGYPANRVFFLNEADAKAAGYRPCAVCMPVEYAQWKAAHTKTVTGR
jgi:metal binding Ada-like protein